MAELTQPLPHATDAEPPAWRGVAAIGRVSAEQLALPGLAVLAGILYLVNLTVSGWANTYYALAAQAASQSWTALFFGSLDASNFVTLDKPPLAILPMALSVKLLGLSPFAILLPDALLGVATVVVLYLVVRRSFGAPAAFIAGLVAALTPVAVLIFRYDNPDALLTFLLVVAAWALGRGLEAGRLRWALLAAVLVGLAFLTKYLQAYLVLPAFGLTWLVCAPVSLRRRVGGLLATGLAVLIASGWWVAIVELIPAASRPYIGGSNHNSVLELIFGYDGLGRIFGSNPGGSGLSSAGPGIGGAAAAAAAGGGPTFSGAPGLLRLLNDQFGGQIAWLLPAARIGLAVGLFLYRRVARSDRRLAGYILWGGWLVTHAIVFSFMSGIIHSYYTVAMVPAVAALAGAGAWDLWQRRDGSIAARIVLAGAVLVTGVVAFLLLDHTPGYVPGLGFAIVAVAAAGALLLVIPAQELDRRVVRGGIALALVAILAGPTAYSVVTVAKAHSGGDPAAGPISDVIGGAISPGNLAIASGDAFTRYLVANQGTARWIVAIDSAPAAAAIQLSTQRPVMSMGGFSGSDPTPTLKQLQAYVSSGELRYVLIGSAGGGPGGGGPAGPGGQAPSRIAGWVAANCTAVSVSGSSVGGLYDCAGST